jgi:hypothetical protein
MVTVFSFPLEKRVGGVMKKLQSSFPLKKWVGEVLKLRVLLREHGHVA